METNKRITISADTSPLSLLRNEISGLTTDVNDLGRASSAVRFNSDDYAQKVEDLKKRLDELNQRNVQTLIEPNLPESTTQRKPSRKPEEIEELSETVRVERPEHITETPQEERRVKPTPTESTREEIGSRREQERTTEKIINVDLSGIESLLKEGNTILSNIASSVRKEIVPRNNSTIGEEIEEALTENSVQSNSSQGITPGSVTPSITPRDPNNPSQLPRENRQNNQEGVGFRAPIEALTNSFLEATRAYATSRNEYEREAKTVGVVGSGIGSGLGMAGMMAGGPAGIAVAVAGMVVSGVSSILSEKMSLETAAREGAEQDVRGWSQTTGETINQSIGRGYQENQNAASNLGLNVGEYMGKRAELLRAAGGKILGTGYEEEDPTGKEEANSMLAVQRQYGISQGTVNQLQTSMRFAEKGDVPQGSSTDSPSAIIRLFENTMKELKLPFSEIASTMEESLSTFNRTVSNVLDKTGSVDAGAIASSLANIRANTGMEGKQLERVQKAVTGQEISKDPTSQALLIQSARDVYGKDMSFPEIMAKTEQIGQDPELQKKFLEMIEKFSGGNESQMQSMLKQIFPNLSWQDTLDITKGDKDLSSVLDGGRAPEVAVGNERDSKYKPSAAKGTVGDIEAQNKKTDTERIGMPSFEQGSMIIKILTDILKEVGLIRSAETLKEFEDVFTGNKTNGEFSTALDQFVKKHPAMQTQQTVMANQFAKIIADWLKSATR